MLLPATPLAGALLATLALFLPGFLLLWAMGPAGNAGWSSLTWRGRGGDQRRRGGPAAGRPLSAGVAERRAGPNRSGAGRRRFLPLRVQKLPILALASLLVGAALLQA